MKHFALTKRARLENMGGYTWICLTLFYICVTKTVQGQILPDTHEASSNSYLNDKLDTLEDKYHEQKHKIEDLETTLSEQKNVILELKGNLKMNEQLIKDQNDKISQLEESNLSWQEKFEKHNGEISLLKARLEVNEPDNKEQSEIETNKMPWQRQADEQNSEMSQLERKIEMVEETCQEWFFKQDNKTLKLEEKLVVAERTCQENINLQKNQLVELKASLQTQEEDNKKKFKSQTDEIEDLRKDVSVTEHSLSSRMTYTLREIHNYTSKDHQIHFLARVEHSYLDTDTAIKFNDVISNIGNCYNKTTHIFTAKIAGYYEFLYHVDVSYLASTWLIVAFQRKLNDEQPGSYSYYRYKNERYILHLGNADQVYCVVETRVRFPPSVWYGWFSSSLLKAD